MKNARFTFATTTEADSFALRIKNLAAEVGYHVVADRAVEVTYMASGPIVDVNLDAIRDEGYRMDIRHIMADVVAKWNV